MGGSSQKVGITEEEKALADISLKQMEDYNQTGRPMIQEAAARFSGFEVDRTQTDEDGYYQLQPIESNVSHADGSTKFSSAAADSAAEKAFTAKETTSTLAQGNQGVADAVQAELGKATSAATAGAKQRTGQQDARIGTLGNIHALGQGAEASAIAGQQDLAAQAAGEAQSSAVQSFNRRAQNRQTLGSAVGAGSAYGERKGFFGGSGTTGEEKLFQE